MKLSRRSVLTSPLLLAAARPRDTLIFGMSSYPTSLDPWLNAGANGAGLKLLIYRALLSYDTDGQLRGELAESWGQDGDNVWVFKLRDAVFHNGAKVTSDDVKWTIEQVAADKSTGYLRAECRSIARVETPDDKTVRIVTSQPTVTIPVWMASTYLPIIARGSTDNGGQPVGAGPFVLAAQERGVSLDMVAFDKFYRPGQPVLKAIKLVNYGDENLRVAALHSGDVDLIEYVPWQTMQGIEDDPNLRLNGTVGSFMYLTFNGKSGPFRDARVRRAVALAIKRDEIVKAVFFGRGSPMEGLPIQQNSPFYNEKLAHGWSYDPARARALLAEAGYPNGFSSPLLATAQYSMMQGTAEFVQRDLAAIGITVGLDLPEMSVHVVRGNRGQFEFSVAGTALDNNDPDSLGSLIDGSLPASFQRSYEIPIPEITTLLDQGRHELDLAARKATYDKLQQVAIDEPSFVGICWRSQGYAMTKALKGFKNLPGALTFYSNLTLDGASLS
jgi:peptide/nickel transport system substrate-binding protein